MNKLFDFKETGLLKIDKVFFENYYPILFTCINEKGGIYICVCCQADSNIRKWLITETSPKTLIDMLSNKITIRDSFLKDKGPKFTIIYNMIDKYFEIEENNLKDWDSEGSTDLPTVGEYIDAEEDEFCEEIAYFESLKIRYQDYIETETMKLPQKQILRNETYDYNSYSSHAYTLKYTINSIKELNDNDYFSLMGNRIEEKLYLNKMDDILEDYLNSFSFAKEKQIDLSNKMDEKKDFCIGDKKSNYVVAA